LEMHYPEGVDVKNIANSVVGSGGQINGQELKKEMLKASFNVYKAAKGFDGIIIMDENITKFLYIGSPEDMESASNSLVVAFPSWSDTQSNAMKVTLSKGTRDAGSSGAASSAPAAVSQDNTDKLNQVTQKRLTGPGVKASGRAQGPKTDTATTGRERRKQT